MNKQYRQGDVLLQRIESLPAGVTIMNPEDGRLILAKGEVTGHSHAIDAEFGLMYSANGKIFVVIRPGAALRHEEHNELQIDPGTYEVIHQREYEHQGWHRVED